MMNVTLTQALAPVFPVMEPIQSKIGTRNMGTTQGIRIFKRAFPAEMVGKPGEQVEVGARSVSCFSDALQSILEIRESYSMITFHEKRGRVQCIVIGMGDVTGWGRGAAGGW